MALMIMKAFKKQLLLTFSLLCCISIKAQDRLGFCLLQEMNFLMDGYDVRLEKILHDHLSEDFMIRCIFMPSFDPECVLQIERIPKTEDYQIITLSFEKNLWCHKNDSIGVSTNTMCIEKNKALGLINLTCLFFENKSDLMQPGCVNDGETIQFEVNVCGEKQCGATQCPTEESLTGRLVKIFDILRASVNSGKTNQEVLNLIKCLYNEASAYYKGENFEERSE